MAGGMLSGKGPKVGSFMGSDDEEDDDAPERDDRMLGHTNFHVQADQQVSLLLSVNLSEGEFVLKDKKLDIELMRAELPAPLAVPAEPTPMMLMKQKTQDRIQKVKRATHKYKALKIIRELVPPPRSEEAHQEWKDMTSVCGETWNFPCVYVRSQGRAVWSVEAEPEKEPVELKSGCAGRIQGFQRWVKKKVTPLMAAVAGIMAVMQFGNKMIGLAVRKPDDLKKLLYEKKNEALKKKNEVMKNIRKSIKDAKAALNKGKKAAADAQAKLDEAKAQAASMKEQADQMKDQANQMKDQADQMKEQAMDQANALKDQANQMKDQAMEMKDQAMDQAAAVQAQAGELKEQASQMKEEALDQAAGIKDQAAAGL
jgi:hypothetical protein